MAFGSSMKEQKRTGGSGDGEKQTYESQWMPKVAGVRPFRLLPAMKDGEVLLTPRLSSTGAELREGNKKNGAVLMGPEPEEEVGFLSAWWEVMIDGSPQKRRLIMDASKDNARFNNPLWDYIQKNFAKGAPERSTIKWLCALNVYDMTPVIHYEGNIYYPDNSKPPKYRVQAYIGNGRLVTNPVEGEAAPLNKVRILEISTGEPGGKHTFQQLADLASTVEDSDGLIRRLPEFDLKLTTQGEGIKTIYSIRNTANFKPLSEEVIKLPRYNLHEWLKPWPDDAIVALLDGADFNEVVEEYNITLFPSLPTATTEEAETNEFD